MKVCVESISSISGFDSFWFSQWSWECLILGEGVLPYERSGNAYRKF